jgi:hypothetical protein
MASNRTLNVFALLGAALIGAFVYATMFSSSDNQQGNHQMVVMPQPTVAAKSEDELEQQAELKQREIGKNAASVEEVGTKSKEADRIEFQRRFPTLEKPMPNLRWYPSRATAEFKYSSLVTPYGVCVMMFGNESGYSLTTMTGSAKFENYPDRPTAINAAEKACHEWYLNRKLRPYDPAKDDALWFPPEPEQ